MFDKEYFDQIINYIEKLVNKSEKYALEHNRRDFVTHLNILGIKTQENDYIIHAEKIISPLPLLCKAEVYRRVGDYYLQQEDPELKKQGINHIQQAFSCWKESVDIEPLKDSYLDFAILNSLKEANLNDLFFECEKLFLAQIQSLPSNKQPLLLARLAESLLGVKDTEEINQYFTLAETIISDSSLTKNKFLPQTEFLGFPNQMRNQ